ncbi:tape measure protein [Acinetobacter oleivorans]|uniref:tape measure protein n=1 Tax=Acinetobacter oleivorans TaxID=1148157 RepID=UPI0018FF2039|nr:tape measure protein [Acinetobacter oleivorans]MBJ9739698.1 tape measure protein [Acinetobacter oleivorans]MCU4409698.1 tape measure protein [Acinetobacter oleivorans]
MAQESRLVIVIDSQNAERNVKALAEELSKFTDRGDSASKSSKDMGKQLSVTNNIVQNFNTTVNNSNTSVQKSVEVTKQATQQNHKFAQEIKTTTNELDKQDKAANSFGTSIKALAGYMAGLATVNAAIGQIDAYTGLQNRLKLVTKDQTELNKATEDTFRIAQNTYSAWDSVLQVYQRFSDNAKTLNLTMDDTARLTETVSKAVAISGASASAADAALVQFGQALASGTLRGEELNSVMEQTPALAKAIAQGMGITVGELRTVAAEGKITSQEIVKALRNVESDVDALFGRTDITISQSLTLLNNEITKFVGEASQGSGAAQVLSGSIKILAENLESISYVAILGGTALLTKAIATQVSALNTKVGSLVADNAASQLQKQKAIESAKAALAEAEAHLVNVRATNAETQAKFGASAASARYVLAAKNVENATKAVTLAQGKSASMAGLLSGAWGLIGGPIGAITLGVTALAATYMYFSSKSAEATAKLKEQAEAAKLTKEEIKALNDEQRKEKLGDLAATIEDQNKALERQELAVGSALINIQNYAVGNAKVAEISNKARLGTISYTEAIEQLKSQKIPADLMDALLKQVNAYDEAAETAAKTKQTYSLFGFEVIIAGNKAENAIVGVDKNTKSLNENERAALAAKNAQKQYADSLADRKFEALVTKGLLAKGYSPEQVKQMVETASWARKSGVEVSNELYQIGLQTLSIEEQNKKVIDAKNKALKETTNELSKQQKLSKRLVGVSGKSGIGTGPHLDVRYGGSMSGQKVSNEHLARLQAGGKPLSSYKISSNYGPRQAPTKGASSFHKGIDFSMPEGTPITTNVAVKDIKTRYDSKGGGYVSEVIFEDGVTLKLLHQSPSMQSKVKGGASKGSDKASGDIQSQLDHQLDAQRSLENEVATELQRIQNNLTVRLEDVDKAGFSPERTKEIKAELQRRADNDIAIAKQATRSKLEDYKEFQKTEADLLKENFDRKKFNAAHDIELSKSEQKQAVELLEQQYQQENALMKLAQEQRAFQARLSLLSETQAMQERYRLEREEIAKTVKDPEERQARIAFSKANQDKETRNKVNNAVQNWGGIQADMNGSSEFYRQDQERFSRLGAVNDLADSQYAATDLSEQSGLDGLNAQMEAGLIQQQDFENQKTAIIQAAQEQRSQIYNDYAQNVKDVEDKYQQDRLNTQIALGGQMMGSVTSMFGSMFGEQSKAYKLMFAADKAYAIAAAGIAIQQNIAAASKVGFPYNLPLIAGAVAQGVSIIANIRAIKDQGFADGGYTGSGGKYDPAGIVHKGEVVWSQEDIRRWGGVGLVENMRKSSGPEAFINNHAINNTSAENVFNRSFLSSKAFNDNQTISNIFNQPTRENQIVVNDLKPSKDAVSKFGVVQNITNQYAGNNSSFSNVLDKSIQSSNSFTANKSNLSNFSNSKIQNSNVSNSTVQNAQKELLREVSVLKGNGFADGGYTGKGKKYDLAGAVHKGEIVWSQDDIKKWGGVAKVEQLRKARTPDSFMSNYSQNNTSFENIVNRANQSSRAFNQSRDISNIFNQSYQDDQIIYNGNTSVANPTNTANSDLFHDGKVYFSSNGLVQDRSNLEDVQDFTSGQSPRPQAEFMPSLQQSSPTINFKIEVVNQVSGATVEAEQLDEKTVRIIVREELDKQLPKAVPRLVSEEIKNPNSLVSRSLTENTTARRNR